jgi:hypothetical protein
MIGWTRGRPLVRRSIRQFIAMTQGILSTSRRDSGIARSSHIDAFTRSTPPRFD